MHTLEQVHPKLRPLVSAFLMKSKYPYTLMNCGRAVNVQDGGEWGIFSMTVSFYDPNYMLASAGSLKFGLKSDNTPFFMVVGRQVVAPRRKLTEDRFSKASSDEKKTLKLMRQMITPYTLNEISGFYTNRVEETLRPWRTALYSKTRVPYQRISYETVVAELRNLKNLGVNPVTSEFRGMMEETLAYHDEYEYRNSVPVTKAFLVIREDGIHTMVNGALEMYHSFDALPKDYQGKLAILKMLKDGDSIPEVGIRIDAKTFWLFFMPERVDAGNK